MSAPPRTRTSRFGGLLDAEPLRQAIERDIARLSACSEDERPRGVGELARLTGIAERRLYGLRRGQPRVALDVADRYCCATDRHLSDLYPELYDDERIEADVAQAGEAA